MALTKVTYSMTNGASANVLDFGAVGDGVTDDTAAIQAALDSGAKEVYFPSGTYIVSDTIYVYGNTTVSGNGTSTVLKTSATRPTGSRWTDIDGGVTDSSDFVPMIVLAASDINLQNFDVICDNSTAGTRWDAGVYSPCVLYINITNVNIQGGWEEAALYIDGTWSDRNTTLKTLHPEVTPGGGNNEINVTNCRLSGRWAYKLRGVDASVRNPADYYGSPYPSTAWLWSWAGTSDIAFTNVVFRNATGHFSLAELNADGGVVYDSVPIPNGTGAGAGNFHRYVSCAFRASSDFIVYLDWTNGNNFIGCGGETTSGYISAYGSGTFYFTNNTGSMTRIGDDINAAMIYFNGVTEQFLDREDFNQNGTYAGIYMTRNNNDVLNMPGIRVNKEEQKITALRGYDANATVATDGKFIVGGDMVFSKNNELNLTAQNTNGYDLNEYCMAGKLSKSDVYNSGILQCSVLFKDASNAGKIEFMSNATADVSAAVYDIDSLSTAVDLYYYDDGDFIEFYIKSKLSSNMIVYTLSVGEGMSSFQISYDNTTPPNVGSFVLITPKII